MGYESEPSVKLTPPRQFDSWALFVGGPLKIPLNFGDGKYCSVYFGLGADPLDGGTEN